MLEWAYLVVALLTTEQQKDFKVRCLNNRCWTEVGGFRDSESCTLALLAHHAEMERKKVKIERGAMTVGGKQTNLNKCFQQPRREFTPK